MLSLQQKILNTLSLHKAEDQYQDTSSRTAAKATEGRKEGPKDRSKKGHYKPREWVKKFVIFHMFTCIYILLKKPHILPLDLPTLQVKLIIMAQVNTLLVVTACA